MSAIVKKSKVLRVFPITQPIDGQLYVDVTFSCSLCDDGSAVARLTDLQRQQNNCFVGRDSKIDYVCQKCVPDRPARHELMKPAAKSA